MIYFALDTGSAAVKIGHSVDPVHRLVTLQTGSANQLILIGAIEGAVEREQQLHAEMEGFHIRGEWFRADPDLIEVVGAILESGGCIDKRAEAKAYADLVWILKNGGSEAFSVKHEQGKAIKEQIRTIASAIAFAGGRDAMQRVYDAIEEYALRNYSESEATHIMYCLDHRFDGIGGWYS